ncbi:MAG: Spy/CpxP family protein refolding chaperone [Bosea sp. (in: a-proteobacteria)]
MKRLALVAAAAVIAFGASQAMAQSGPFGGGDGPSPERMQRMEKRFDDRLNSLRGDLKLTPEQAPLWQPVEAMIRRNMADRRARMQSMRGQFRDAELPKRMEMIAERQAAQAGRMRELSATVQPLWATLSADQKQTVQKAIRKTMGGRHGGESRRG